MLKRYDPLVLSSLYQVAQTSKSTALALALVCGDFLEEAEKDRITLQ